jgi:hypothetical protein
MTAIAPTHEVSGYPREQAINIGQPSSGQSLCRLNVSVQRMPGSRFRIPAITLELIPAKNATINKAPWSSERVEVPKCGKDEYDQPPGLERVAGIEPAYSAWKAAALPLSYTRIHDPPTVVEGVGFEPT